MGRDRRRWLFGAAALAALLLAPQVRETGLPPPRPPEPPIGPPLRSRAISLEVRLPSTPGRIPVPLGCDLQPPVFQRWAEQWNLTRHRWVHATALQAPPPRAQALATRAGLRPGDWVGLAAAWDPWWAEGLARAEASWARAETAPGDAAARARIDRAYQDRVRALAAIDPTLADLAEWSAIARDDRPPTDAQRARAVEVLLGSDQRRLHSAALAVVCDQDLALDAPTHAALRRVADTLPDRAFAVRIAELGLRSAWNLGPRDEVAAWADTLERAQADCEDWDEHGELAERELPGFDDLPASWGPAGVGRVVDEVVARVPGIEALPPDCAEAPCVLAFRVPSHGDHGDAVQAVVAALWGDPVVQWTGDPDGNTLLRLAPPAPDRIGSWRLSRAAGPAERCLPAGDLAAARERYAPRPPRDWREALRQGAVACHAEAALRADARVEGRWEDGAWRWDVEVPWLACLSGRATLPPDDERPLILSLELDDG